MLAFFTGAERIPVLGFDYPPCVRFSATTIFPTASTCALELTLPTRYFNQPELFKEKITYAMLNHAWRFWSEVELGLHVTLTCTFTVLMLLQFHFAYYYYHQLLLPTHIYSIPIDFVNAIL